MESPIDVGHVNVPDSIHSLIVNNRRAFGGEQFLNFFEKNRRLR